MDSIKNACEQARRSRFFISGTTLTERNRILSIISSALIEGAEGILKANFEDVRAAAGKPDSFLDRLSLTKKRIEDLADSLKSIIDLPDPLGIELDGWLSGEGLRISKSTVPLGVVGIIYEARPNVTIDAAALCIKSGNAVVLRGSKDAILSNIALVKTAKDGLMREGIDPAFIQLIEDTTREGAEYFMSLNKLVDVLIPRGSASLINTAVEKSKIPVIETGTGNCHIYVEKTADIEMAKKILINAKMQRQSVCNCAESLLVDRDIAKTALPELLGALRGYNCEIRACAETLDIFKDALLATDEDYYTEFLANIISCKIVGGYSDAIDHINKCGTGHSDSIITSDPVAAEAFRKGVDSAAVYVNASTRFTDGGVFGFGAEMGISTQKLHARGPMGLRELTSYKYVIEGNGQVRE